MVTLGPKVQIELSAWITSLDSQALSTRSQKQSRVSVDVWKGLGFRVLVFFSSSFSTIATSRAEASCLGV